MYRLVPAASLLQDFASDRSHMRRPDGSWSAQPPPYPCITATDSTHMNLGRFTDMTVDVLQDRVPCQHSSTHQGPEAAAAAAASEKGGKHPCQAAACISTHQGYDTGGGSGGDRQGSSGSTAVPDVAAAGHSDHGHQAVASSSIGSEGPRHQQHAPDPSTGHVFVAGTVASTADAHHSGVKLVMWYDVVTACELGKFGAVLHEHTLLRCLLGAAAGGAS